MASIQSGGQVFKHEVWQDALSLNRSEMLWRRALRQLVGNAVMYGAVWYLFGQELGLAALAGALTAGFRAISGPSRARSRFPLYMTALMTVSIALPVALGGSVFWGSVALAVLAFMMTLGGRADSDYRSLTLSAVSYVVVYTGMDRAPHLWLDYGFAVAAGGLGQWLFLSLVWPTKPLEPERNQLSALYSQLAQGLRSLSDQEQAELILHQSEQLSKVQQAADQALSPKYERAQAVIKHLLSCGYVIDGALTRLGKEALNWRNTSAEPHVDSVTDQAAALLESFAADIKRGKEQPSERDWAQWEALPSQARAVSAEFTEATKTLVKAMRLIQTDPWQHLPISLPKNETFLQKLAKEVKDPVSLSFSLLFGLTLGVMVYVAAQLSDSYDFEHGYWLAMTFSLVMSVNPKRLLKRGLARVAGTVAGLLFVGVLTGVLGDSTEISTLLLAFAVYISLVTLNAGYSALTFSFTVYAIALSDSSGLSSTVLERFWLTLGGVLAAYGLYQIWPTWTKGELASALAELKKDYAELKQANEALNKHSHEEAPKQARLALLKLGESYVWCKTLVTAARLELRSKPDRVVESKSAEEAFVKLERQITAEVGQYASLSVQGVGLPSYCPADQA